MNFFIFLCCDVLRSPATLIVYHVHFQMSTGFFYFFYFLFFPVFLDYQNRKSSCLVTFLLASSFLQIELRDCQILRSSYFNILITARYQLHLLTGLAFYYHSIIGHSGKFLLTKQFLISPIHQIIRKCLWCLNHPEIAPVRSMGGVTFFICYLDGSIYADGN